jgi:hypothetical protein
MSAFPSNVRGKKLFFYPAFQKATPHEAQLIGYPEVFRFLLHQIVRKKVGTSYYRFLAQRMEFGSDRFVYFSKAESPYSQTKKMNDPFF